MMQWNGDDKTKQGGHSEKLERDRNKGNVQHTI